MRASTLAWAVDGRVPQIAKHAVHRCSCDMQARRSRHNTPELTPEERARLKEPSQTDNLYKE
jgi:hypothetical protein